MSFDTLSDRSGPLGLLAARGVVPLDYEGMATALPECLPAQRRLRTGFSIAPRLGRS
jgi:hypothetical protein